MKNSIDYSKWKLDRLKNYEYAKGYLQVALDDYYKDQDDKAFLSAIKDVVTAQKGMTDLAKETGINRQSLYKSFSEKGNPTFSTLTNVLEKIGYKISIESI